MSTSFTQLNIDDVKDLAPDYGMADFGEARFAREQLGAEQIGLSHYRVNAGARIGFGHRHADAEEIYVVLAGSGRFMIDDAQLDVGPRDVVYVAGLISS